MPRVKIPPPYRGPTRGQAVIDVAGTTVRECLEAVNARYPGFAEQVFDGDGLPHRFVALFVNGVEIGRGESDAAIAESDELEILAAIAGG